jgi:hypothetical protein
MEHATKKFIHTGYAITLKRRKSINLKLKNTNSNCGRNTAM